MAFTPRKTAALRTPDPLEHSPFTPRQRAQLLQRLQRQNYARSPKHSIYRGSSPLRPDASVSEYSLVGTVAPGAATTTTVRRTLAFSASGNPRRAGRPSSTAKCDRFIARASVSSSNTRSIRMQADDAAGGGGGGGGNVATAKVVPPSPESLAYTSSVAAACGIALDQRVLAFKPEPPQSSQPIDLRLAYNRPLRPAAQAAHLRRNIQTAPERVLDAPGLLDDYYLNLLDWSATNQIAIGLERNVYVWNADTGNVTSLVETSEDTYVAGLKWSGDGAYLGVGLATGDVQIYDVETGAKLRSMTGHQARVGVLAWDKHTLSSGCRDGSIWNHDVRIQQHKVSEWNNHQGEVCGLDWRSDGAQLASGGNDNLVNIWDSRCSVPKFSKTNHKAAVKALAWCPWQCNLLATGGGSHDRHIHFWNSTTGARLNSIDASSQVTSLRWSTVYREIVSSHGFPDNYLSVWSYPSLTKHIDIPAHETRVLHSALSPDGQVLATAASDECLKMWKLFESVGRKALSYASNAMAGVGKGEENVVRKSMMIR